MFGEGIGESRLDVVIYIIYIYIDVTVYMYIDIDHYIYIYYRYVCVCQNHVFLYGRGAMGNWGVILKKRSNQIAFGEIVRFFLRPIGCDFGALAFHYCCVIMFF